MKAPKNKQIAVKRIFAVFSAVCLLLVLFASFAFGVSATSYTIDGGFVIINNDEMILTDEAPQAVLLDFSNDSLFAFNESGVRLYIIAKYTDDTTSRNWILESDERDVQLTPTVSAPEVLPLDRGQWALYSFTLNSTLPIFVDGFSIVNYSDQILGVEVSVPEVAFIAFVSTYRYDMQEAEYTLLRLVDALNASNDIGVVNGYLSFYENGYNFGYDEGYGDGYDEGYGDGYSEGYTEGEDIGYDEGYGDGYSEGYTEGEDIGYDEGYMDGADGIGIEKLPFAVTDSIANMFVTITNFEILGINILSLLGSIISICVVAFVIKKVF